MSVTQAGIRVVIIALLVPLLALLLWSICSIVKFFFERRLPGQLEKIAYEILRGGAAESRGRGQRLPEERR